MEFKLNQNRVSKYYRLPTMGQTARAEELAPEDKLYKNTIPLVNNVFIYGLEVEVENCPEPVVKCTNARYWDLTADNSLRNYGVEYVSKPLTCQQVEYALDQLNNSLPKDAIFSPRTSVHVHMNVRDLTIDQISCLILLYTSVENLLFNWVGHDRDKNVFCIKITETEYVQNFLEFQENPNNVTHFWNKYTALNILPIESKGTVEFRHMYGTSDKEILLQWINFLSCLKLKAKNSTSTEIFKQIQQLNTTSAYEYYIQSIFHGHADALLQTSPDIKQCMEDAISYVKLTAIQHIPNNLETTPTPIWGNPYNVDIPPLMEREPRRQEPVAINPLTRRGTLDIAEPTPTPPPTVGQMINDLRRQEELRAARAEMQRTYELFRPRPITR